MTKPAAPLSWHQGPRPRQCPRHRGYARRCRHCSKRRPPRIPVAQGPKPPRLPQPPIRNTQNCEAPAGAMAGYIRRSCCFSACAEGGITVSTVVCLLPEPGSSYIDLSQSNVRTAAHVPATGQAGIRCGQTAEDRPMLRADGSNRRPAWAPRSIAEPAKGPCPMGG